MPWVEVFAVFLVCHLVGDYLLQTEHQAAHKHHGLGRDPVARRALASHAFWYTASFLPALVWLAADVSTPGVIGAGLAIGIPHAIFDDGHVLSEWMRRVKRTAATPGTLAMMVDQSFHIVALFAVAVAVGA